MAVSEERLAGMQRALARVWRRFAWSSYRPYAAAVSEALEQNAARRREVRGEGEGGAGAEQQQGTQGGQQQQRQGQRQLSLPPAEEAYDPSEDDAFSTLMQWLYWKIQDTR